MQRNLLTLVISLLLGIAFLIAGLGKIFHFQAYVVLFVKSGLENGLSTASVAFFSAIVEVAIGLALVTGAYWKTAVRFIIPVLLFSTGFYFYGNTYNNVLTCACFGFMSDQLDSWIIYARALILGYLGFELLRVANTEKYPPLLAGWSSKISMAVLVIAGFSAGLNYGPIKDKSSKKNEWLGKDFRETIAGEKLKLSSDSSYAVYFFNYDCPNCWNSYENLIQYKSRGVVDQIIGVALKEEVDLKSDFLKSFNPSFPIIEMSIDDVFQHVDRIPTAFFIKQDTVKYTMSEHITSVYLFERTFGSLSKFSTQEQALSERIDSEEDSSRLE